MYWFRAGILLLLLTTLVYAAFEKKYVGAEAVALGNSLAAWRPAAFAVYTNPASISTRSGLTLYAAYRNFFGLPGLSQANLAADFSLFSLPVSFGFGKFGNDLYREFQFRGGVCVKTAHHLYFGAVLNYQHLIIRKAGAAGTWGLNLGVLYYITEQFSLGSYITNINSPAVGKKPEKIPQSFAMGISYTPLTEVSLNFELSRDSGFTPQAHAGILIQPMQHLGLMLGVEDDTNTVNMGAKTAFKSEFPLCPEYPSDTRNISCYLPVNGFWTMTLLRSKIVAVIMVAIVSAAGAGDSLEDNRRALEKVKSEIAALKKDLVRTNLKSSSTLEQISALERELSIVGKSRRLLQKKNRLLNKQISGTKDELLRRRNKLQKFKSEHARRVVYSYKNSGTRDLELLLSSTSFNQALARAKYLNMFAAQEQRLMQKIRFEIDEIDRLNRELQADRKDLRASLREKEKEELAYESKKDKKKLLVSRLRWTEKNLKKRLSDAKAEYQKLYQLILALEKQRRERKKSGERKIDFVLNYKNFSKNKGKLPWPVRGEILHAYGRQHDTKLKTTINNTGIDIKASSGSEVRAIFTGEVSMITYLSGFGNTIILHHGQGYYTVYSHLEDIHVELDDVVDEGEIIGLVGDSGSLEGSKLHFALFSNQQTENPQKWLR